VVVEVAAGKPVPRANEPGWYRCACGEWLHGPPAWYWWCPVLRGPGRPMVDTGDGPGVTVA
jgi:hypothetical protein